MSRDTLLVIVLIVGVFIFFNSKKEKTVAEKNEEIVVNTPTTKTANPQEQGGIDLGKTLGSLIDAGVNAFINNLKSTPPPSGQNR